MAGLQIGDGVISMEITGETTERRTKYHYFIDVQGFEHEGNDLKSGCGGGSLQSGFESLLSFLGAAAEAYQCSMSGHESDNSDIFPPRIMEWAYANSDEIGLLECQLQEQGELITD